MAYIKNIWLRDSHLADGTIRVNVSLKPSGEVALEIPIPKVFLDTIMEMAQTAADHHEAKMKAEILGEQHVAA